jgi:hypothetical protein
MNAKGSLRAALATLFPMMMGACDCDVTGPKIGPGPIDIDVDPPSHEASEGFSYQVALSGQTTVRLKGISGSVHFKGVGAGEGVSVSGTRRVGSDTREDAEAHLAMLEVLIREDGAELLVESKHPKLDGRNYEVDYTVSLPRDMKVQVENTNGDVTLEDLADDAVVQLANGTVKADLTLPPMGLIDLFTVNGDIDLEVQKDASARFEATLTNGQITTSNLDLRDRVATKRTLAGRLGDGAGLIRLGLVNGSIQANGR